MRKIYVLFFLACISIDANAQRSFEMGIAAGVTNYFGDLGNEKVFQSTSTRPGVAVTFRNFKGNPGIGASFYNPLSVEVRFSWHRIGYDETKAIGNQIGFELRNYGRGISFRNDIYGMSTHLTYTFYKNRRVPLFRQGAAMFVFGGAGVFYSKPVADLFRGDIDLANRYYFWMDGTTRDRPEGDGTGNIIEKDGEYETDLREWSTEKGQANGEVTGRNKYKNIVVGFPMGLGFRFGLSNSITLSAEFGYYYFITDFLDDVSSEYITFNDLNLLYPNDQEKQDLALYISDPTGYGTNGYPGPATSPRGNPNKKDAYSFVNLELAYKLHMRGERARFFGRR